MQITNYKTFMGHYDIGNIKNTTYIRKLRSFVPMCLKTSILKLTVPILQGPMHIVCIKRLFVYIYLMGEGGLA